MCVPSRPRTPPPPPTPAPPQAPPPQEVNAAQTKLREQAPKAPKVNTSSAVSYSKKRGKAALRIPLQVGVGSNKTGANVPTP